MHDMRKKALTESLKTTSRKNRAKQAQSTPSAGSVNTSAQTSQYPSAATSRAGSSDEADGVAGAIAKLSIGRASKKAKSKRSRRQLSTDDEENDDSDDNNVYYGELASGGTRWKDAYDGVVEILQDRKRTSNGGRTWALEELAKLLRAAYNSDVVSGDALAEVSEQLVKSVRRGAPGPSQERQFALASLALTTLSCATPADTGLVFDDAFATLKQLITDPMAIESDKAMAIRTLAIVVVCGAGIQSTLEELLNFLLEIAETDGTSVESPDSALVVSAALKAWSFGASFIVDDVAQEAEAEAEAEAAAAHGNSELSHAREEVYVEAERRSRKVASSQADGRDEGDFLHGENYLVAESQRALDVFLDQLESTDADVQIDAGSAVALLYEASRVYEAALDEPLQLQSDARQLAAEIREKVQGASSGSVKSVKRQARRQLRESFRSIATSLERSTGPNFSTATTWRDKDKDKDGGGKESFEEAEEYGHQQRLVVGDRVMAIDTWCKSTRVDMLRAVLAGGLATHLVQNPLVRQMFDSGSLQQSAFSLHRAAEKARKVRKLATKGR